ncbi:MAG: cupin domain-containing protein, partial [Myxococcota bacterium]|nr:cupin domain-containing protein [Myxococcota bacterium]
AATVLLRYLLAPPPPGSTRPRALSASLHLTKFGVLPGQATPTVTLSADADELQFTQEQNAWGDVDVIAQTRLLGLYRLNVAPGAQIPHHLHRVMREAELVLSPGLVGWIHDGPDTPLEPGTVFEWEKELAHGYRNTAAHPASILCLDSPPFQPTDEVTLPRPERTP